MWKVFRCWIVVGFVLELFYDYYLFLIISVVRTTVCPSPIRNIIAYGNGKLTNIIIASNFSIILASTRNHCRLPHGQSTQFMCLSAPTNCLPRRNNKRVTFFFPLGGNHLGCSFRLGEGLGSSVGRIFVMRASIRIDYRRRLSDCHSCMNGTQTFVRGCTGRHSTFILSYNSVINGAPNLCPSCVRISNNLKLPICHVVKGRSVRVNMHSFRRSCGACRSCFNPVCCSFGHKGTRCVVLSGYFCVGESCHCVNCVSRHALR